MLNKVELGSVNNKRIAPYDKVGMTKRDNQSFTGLGNLALRGIQKCEESPMVNVAVLDLSTAIIPRTFFETFIGSKKKDEHGNEVVGRGKRGKGYTGRKYLRDNRASFKSSV